MTPIVRSHLDASLERKGLDRARQALAMTAPTVELYGRPQHFRLDQDYRSISEMMSGNPREFVRQYFGKNLVKACLSYEVFSSSFKAHRRVIDLGTGPGTFIFALSTAYSNTNDYIGIDVNAEALRVASMMFRACRLRQPLLLNGRVPESIISGASFFTCSYMINELGHEERRSFFDWIRYRVDATFLVIDYSWAIGEMASAISGGRRCSILDLRLELPEDIGEVIGDDKISFAACLVSRSLPVN